MVQGAETLLTPVPSRSGPTGTSVVLQALCSASLHFSSGIVTLRALSGETFPVDPVLRPLQIQRIDREKADETNCADPSPLTAISLCLLLESEGPLGRCPVILPETQAWRTTDPSPADMAEHRDDHHGFGVTKTWAWILASPRYQLPPVA